jgi:protein-S-isoprenylcysteine O-methyltransferase Ste14
MQFFGVEFSWVEICCAYKFLTYVTKLPFFLRYLNENRVRTVQKLSNVAVDRKRESVIVWLMIWCDAALTVMYARKYLDFAHLAFINDTAAICGMVLGAISLLGAVWAHLAIGNSWSATVTVQKNHAMCTTGPYRFARHPIYALCMMRPLAILLMSQNVVLALYTAIFVVYASCRINREERLMIELFGERYVDYKRGVGAFWPWKPFGHDCGLSDAQCAEALAAREKTVAEPEKVE